MSIETSFSLAELNDLLDVLKVFKESILGTCFADYSETQLRVWTNSVKDISKWESRIREEYFLLAKDNKDKLMGFGSLKGHDFLNLFFVAPNYQKQGFAKLIYQELENKAKEMGSIFLEADVSITALSFFQKQGFTVLKKNEIEREGVILVNYKMRKNFNESK